MRRPELLDALSDRPELRQVPEGTRAARAAWRAGDGAVLLTWPSRLRRDPTYMSANRRSVEPPTPHDLVAAFLQEADVRVAADTWRDERAAKENRYLRTQAVLRVAAERAAERGCWLRDLRRGDAPKGSCSLAYARDRSPLVLPVVRFPDGDGWWCTSGSPARSSAWEWEENKPDAVLRVLAVGLTELACQHLSGLGDLEEIEVLLR